MLWNRARIVIACTTSLVLFSSNADRHEEIRPIAFDSHIKKAPDDRRIYTIHLTFDDGPSQSSEFINELSRKDSLPVNVFLVGQNVCLDDTHRRLLEAYQANEWIEIGNHSYTHAQRQYKRYFKQPLKVLADFNRSRDSLHLTNNLARLPGRNCFRVESFSRNDGNNGKDAADTLAAYGYNVFGWDIEWCNRPKKNIASHTGEEMLEIVNHMLNKRTTSLPGHLILLLHDKELKDPCFREELENFIQLAKADGKYRFDHLSRQLHAGN